MAKDANGSHVHSYGHPNGYSNGNSRPHRGSTCDQLVSTQNGPQHNPTGALSANNTSARPHDSLYTSKGFLGDITSSRWMLIPGALVIVVFNLLSSVSTASAHPASSAKLLAIPIVLYINWELVTPHLDNPFAHFLFISNRVPDSTPDAPYYAKTYWDIAFILYYIVFWSFVRQTVIFYFLQPLARHYGIKSQAKLDRFGEQGYAVVYNVVIGSTGVYTMYHLPTWYFRTEYFWLDYPQWRLPGIVKTYYLLQFAYWLQQFLLITLRVEKPRKDFTEFVIHHIVTVWLVGWSYLINTVHLGNAVFITMDCSDVFLSLAKCFNYLQMEKTKTVAFGWFTIVWTYLRHYLNIIILWSIWTEFGLIPENAQKWSPKDGVWLASWMRYPMFASMFLLQLLCVFWYVLIWRILLRAIFSSTLDDERSDDEGDEEPLKEKTE